MFDKLKSALGNFVKTVAGKVEEAVKKSPAKPAKKQEPVSKKKPLPSKPSAQKPAPAKPVAHKKPVLPAPKGNPATAPVEIPVTKISAPIPETPKPAQKTGPFGLGGLLKQGLEAGLKMVSEQKLTQDMLDGPVDDLVLSLIEASVALDVADSIGAELKKRLVGKTIPRGKSGDLIGKEIYSVLLDKLDHTLDVESQAKGKPFIIAIAGINGSGKTTTVAKIAYWLQKKDKKLVIAAADTYRAAAIEQLEKHANSLDIKMIKHEYGADAAAVCYDAIQHAKAHNLDAVIIDTAGRMHADAPLMEELEKIVRVNKPDVVLLIIDSLVGNDAIEQLKKFKQVRVDGVILTKSDLDHKGGVALSITASGTPIAFLATGQKYDQLEAYDPKKFLDKIMAS